MYWCFGYFNGHSVLGTPGHQVFGELNSFFLGQLVALQAQLNNPFAIQRGHNLARFLAALPAPVVEVQTFPVICCPAASQMGCLLCDLPQDAVEHLVLLAGTLNVNLHEWLSGHLPGC